MKKKTKKVTVWVNIWGHDWISGTASIHRNKAIADDYFFNSEDRMLFKKRLGNKAHKLTVEVPVD